MKKDENKVFRYSLGRRIAAVIFGIILLLVGLAFFAVGFAESEIGFLKVFGAAIMVAAVIMILVSKSVDKKRTAAKREEEKRKIEQSEQNEKKAEWKKKVNDILENNPAFEGSKVYHDCLGRVLVFGKNGDVGFISPYEDEETRYLRIDDILGLDFADVKKVSEGVTLHFFVCKIKIHDFDKPILEFAINGYLLPDSSDKESAKDTFDEIKATYDYLKAEAKKG